MKFILLDTRYFKDFEEGAPLLGHKQWAWLERELSDSEIKLFFIVSSFPVFAPDMPFSVEWANYPSEKARLLKLTFESQKTPVFFLTGDKHFSSLYRDSQERLEFMASGMTHTTRLPLRPYVRRVFPNYTFQLNFGKVDLSWQGSKPTLDLSLINSEGGRILKERVSWKAGKWVEL